MDDLTGKLMDLLKNPETMEKIKQLTGSYLNTETPEKKEDETVKEDEDKELPIDAINAMMKIMPLISSMNKEDEKTKFLGALRPLLSDKRKDKLDESVKIMQMMRVLPLLKGNGIL